MARCEPVDALSRTILNNVEVVMMESNDSEPELESDVTSDSLNINEEKDCNSDSPENDDNESPHVHAGPVLSLQCLHEDSSDEVLSENFNDNEEASGQKPNEEQASGQKPNEEQHHHLMSVKIAAVNGASSMVTSASSTPRSSIPAMNNWEGMHNFKIKIQCTDIPKKSETPVFCDENQKLYVAKDHPFKVLVFAENVPRGSVIKVTAVFAMVEHSYEVVQRCPTHAQADFQKGNPAYEHFVQCYSDAAVYSINPKCGKLSVAVPYEAPQEGQNFSTYLFKLTCFSSCSGGINRRPFVLVFTLEKDNIPLGRQTIGAKVCACPLRDFKVDVERGNVKRPRIQPSTKPPSEEGAVTSQYTISVKDPELYLFLKQMKCLYEISKYSSKIKQDT